MNTYNVTGTLENVPGVFVSLTVKADTFADAIAKAKLQEPTINVTNVVRVGENATNA